MDEIVASIARVTEVLGEISLAAHEQSDGINQVNIAVADLDRMTQQNVALVVESTGAVGRLEEQANLLTELVIGYTLATQERRGREVEQGGTLPRHTAPVPSAASRLPAIRPASPKSGTPFDRDQMSFERNMQ